MKERNTTAFEDEVFFCLIKLEIYGSKTLYFSFKSQPLSPIEDIRGPH